MRRQSNFFDQMSSLALKHFWWIFKRLQTDMAKLCLFNLMLKRRHDTYSTALCLLVLYQTSYYPSLHHSRYLVSYQTNLCSRWELRRATETVWHLPRRPLHYELPWSCYSFQASIRHLSASQPSEKRFQLKIYLSTIRMQSLVTICHVLQTSFIAL